MAKLRCQSCGAEIDAPMHCGQPMAVQEVGGQKMLVCHMGPDCSKLDVPTHCGAPMVAA